MTKDIKVEERNPNNVYKEWADGILQTAKDTIPRGVTKDYKPHWNPDLQKAHNALNKAREEASIELQSMALRARKCEEQAEHAQRQERQVRDNREPPRPTT